MSSLECESRTCAKPAFTAKLPFSASVLPLILSLFVFPPRVSSQNELIGARNADFFLPLFFSFFSFVCKRGDDTLDKKNVDVAFVETTLLLKQQQKQETRTTTVRSPITVYVKTIAQRYYQPTYV